MADANNSSILIAIIYNKNFLGCSLFFETNHSILLCRDIYDSYESEQIKSIIYKYNVDYGIITTDMDVERYDFISETGMQMHFGSRKRKYTSLITRLMEFLSGKGFDTAMESLLLILNHIKFEHDIFPPHEFLIQKKYECTKINMADNVLGDLIATLGYYSFYIKDIGHRLYMSVETVNSLKLINYIEHPNNLIASKKETDSLLSFLNHTKTSMGYNLLKNNVLFPLTDINQITQRQNAIEFITTEKLTHNVAEILKNCTNIDANEFMFFKEHKSLYFVKLYNLLSSFIEINKTFLKSTKKKNIPHFLNFPGDKSIYESIIKKILDNIDFVETKFCIKSLVSEELDYLKNRYKDLENYLNDIAANIQVNNNTNLDESKKQCNSTSNTSSTSPKETLSIVYFTQLGYLIESNIRRNSWELKFEEQK